MLKKILIASDLSARSDRALQRGLALAHERQAEVEVIHVVDRDWPRKIIDQMEASASATLAEQIAAVSRSKEVRLATHIIRGQDYVEILNRAESIRADLIVIGAHRHSLSDLFRGTTTDRIVRFGRNPVLFVREPVGTSYQRVIVGVDMSVHSLRALEIAAELVPNGKFKLIHATHAPFKAFLGREATEQAVRSEQTAFGLMLEKEISALTGRLGSDVPRFEATIEEGMARIVLRKHIGDFKPDLVAIGTHSRVGISHAIVGSVAEDLLVDAPADILVAKAS